MNEQLALAIQLIDEATLGNFHWGANTLLQQQVTELLKPEYHGLWLYLWGPRAVGKSHLLQAISQAQPALSAIYLPLHVLKKFGPEVMQGLEHHQVVCIDDIDAIAGDNAWEEALFHLLNHIRDHLQTRLIISASTPPSTSPVALADLKSRLGWGMVIQLHELQDDDKLLTLQSHARKRGFELPTPVAQFLITRCGRNMHSLNQLLQQLDETSLAAQRKITIPFVKQALSL